MKQITFSSTASQREVAKVVLQLKALADQQAFNEMNTKIFALEASGKKALVDSDKFVLAYRNRRKKLQVELIKELFPQVVESGKTFER
ncbi:MAG TPA: hypothetical protein VK618_12500 [Flavitalea sp.]|nr:hypothetical protein [Flavitalea sp.]